MINRITRIVPCVLLACTLAVHSLSAQDTKAPGLPAPDLPAPVGKVNDFAKLLEPSQRQTLEAQLADLERATSAEVALVTMQTLGDQPLEKYATTLFNAWGIGKKDLDNGVMVLVVVRDRAMRIEVGRGLEGVLPDRLAAAVIQETFLPRFRNGDYAGGVRDGMARVIEIVRRNEKLTPGPEPALERSAADAGTAAAAMAAVAADAITDPDAGKSWELVWLISVFVCVGAFAFGTAAGAKVVIQLLFGLAVTGGVLYFSSYVVPRTAIWMMGGLAVVVATGGGVLVQRPKWRRRMRGTGARAGSSAWISESTSSSSSGDSSGSSSSGDFGGGSSSGGGASGHW
jgi:uncharacterized protein